MKTYIHSETGDIVNEERWGWGALYKDGTELHQFNKDNDSFHRIGEVVQENVKLWVLYEMNGTGRIDIVVKEGMKLIHKYTKGKLNVGSDAEREYHAYKFGYKLNGAYHFNYILPNNTIVQSTEDIILTEFGI